MKHLTDKIIITSDKFCWLLIDLDTAIAFWKAGKEVYILSLDGETEKLAESNVDLVVANEDGQPLAVEGEFVKGKVFLKNKIIVLDPEHEDRFPNGFKSWHETHYEIVSQLNDIINGDDMNYPPKIGLIVTTQGRGGMYELAQELTDKFEKENKGRKWDGEFYDIIQEFINENLK